MKILLMGDSSNYHYTLACALRLMGYDVTVASSGSGWMDTTRDIDLSRRSGRVGGGILWLKLNSILSGKFKGYDVVQLNNPIFLDLKPKRVKVIFDRIRRNNGSVFLSMLGTDSPYVSMCLSKDSPLRYSEFSVDGEPTPYAISHSNVVNEWQDHMLSDHCRYIYDNIDGAVTALYEYHLVGLRNLPSGRLAYAGIPVDTSAIPFETLKGQRPLRIMVASHKGREAEKGIDRILPVVKKVVDNYPARAVLDIVQNVPFDEFRKRLRFADIVVDQLYSYTPATSALMAMASGKIVVSGAEPEYYDFIGEKDMHPIVNANPLNIDSLYSDIERIICDDALRQSLSLQGRQFVEKHNDMMVVAKKFVDFWQAHLGV